jgi:hypothetical protein
MRVHIQHLYVNQAASSDCLLLLNNIQQRLTWHSNTDQPSILVVNHCMGRVLEAPLTTLSVIISAVVVRINAIKVFVMRGIPLDADVAATAAAQRDPAETT